MANSVSDRTISEGCKQNGTPQLPDRIAAHFQDKVLLITGGTGFMGKVLVEKILRTSDVKRIYLLIRNKIGKDAQSRIREIFSIPLFDLLKKIKGEDVLKRVVAISGDVALPGLGLSDENRRLLAQEVNIIYHFAATVRFNESIKRAVLLNVRGTHLMLKLAKECSNLTLFVHASTAYCHLKEKVLYEKPYPPPAAPQAIIKTIEWLEEDVIETIRDKILGDEPNTYTFSKAVSESIAVEAMDSLPVIVLRFPIVISSWKEPIPGWIDNINGPIGIFIAAGKGVLRTMYCDPNKYGDFIPVDIATNATLIFTYNYELHKERRIYNCTSSDRIKITWGEVIEKGKKVITTTLPLNTIMWYPGGSMKRSKILHWVCVILFHYIPALLFDPLIWLSGNKPVLWRVQQKLTKALEVLEYFANNQWDFDNEQAKKAKAWMNQTERSKYDVDADDFDVDDYILKAIHGARLYLLKEGDHTIPSAKASVKRMWFLDRFCKLMMVVGFVYFIWTKFLSPW